MTKHVEIKKATKRGCDATIEKAIKRVRSYMINYADYAKRWTKEETEKRCLKQFKSVTNKYYNRHDFDDGLVSYFVAKVRAPFLP